MKTLKYCPSCFNRLISFTYGDGFSQGNHQRKMLECPECSFSIRTPMSEDSFLFEYFNDEIVKKALKKKLIKSMESFRENNVLQEKKFLEEIEKIDSEGAFVNT